MGQAVGRARGREPVVIAADGGGHRLAGRVLDLIEQHGFVCLAPEVGKRALGVGIGVEQQVTLVAGVVKHPPQRAELVERQRPRRVGREAERIERAEQHLDARSRQLCGVGFRHRRVGHKRRRAVRVLRPGAGQRHHDAAVIRRAPQVGVGALAVAVQHGKRRKNQVHVGASCGGKGQGKLGIRNEE